MAATILSEDTLVLLRAEAQIKAAGNGGFADPRACNRAQDAMRRRGEQWAASVCGRTFGRRSIAFPSLPWLLDGEPELLDAADAAETEIERVARPAGTR